MFVRRIVIQKMLDRLLHAGLGDIDIYCVTGLRRSGNHSIVEWIKNGFDDPEAPIDYTVGWNEKVGYVSRELGWSANKTVVHLNQINRVGLHQLIGILRVARKEVKGDSQVLIVSAEDYSPLIERWWSRNAVKRIFITRDLLNLVASRINILKKRAAVGQTADTFSIYKMFFVHWYQLNNPPDGCCQAHYERWLGDKSYRNELAVELQMPANIIPSYVSEKGGGSSFIGRDLEGDYLSYTQRYKQVSWDKQLVARILRLDSEKSCLKTYEREFLRHLSEREHGD